jgi:hypothetical protein
MKKILMCQSNVLIIAVFVFNLTAVDLSAQQIVLGHLHDTAAKTQTCVIPGMELIEFVGNTSSVKGTITAIVYKLNNAKHKPTKIVKPHLYKVSGKNVGEELLPTNMPTTRLTSKGKQLRLQIDVSKYNIELPPEGVFVGIEYVDIELTDKKDMIQPLTAWHDEYHYSSISYSKYKNVIEKDTLTFSKGYCFGVQVEPK